MRHQASAGTVLEFPISTRLRASDASIAGRFPLLGQAYNDWFWHSEDFLHDSLDLTKTPFALYDASAAGSPTADVKSNETGGVYQIQLAATSEAETVGLTNGDMLGIQGNRPFFFAARVKVISAMAANQNIVIGLGSAMNTTTLDNLTRNLWFRQTGAATNLLLEADDNTTDQSVDSGLTVTANVYNWYVIEQGVGGVYFSFASAHGASWRTHKLSSPKFSGSEPVFGANNLQVIIAAQKTSGTTQPEIYIDAIVFAGERGA